MDFDRTASGSKMTQIKAKRVYEEIKADDGFRVLVDRLWPRGIKKDNLNYDLWEKSIEPSKQLREWFHKDKLQNWEEFKILYTKELENSNTIKEFIDLLKTKEIVTLLL